MNCTTALSCEFHPEDGRIKRTLIGRHVSFTFFPENRGRRAELTRMEVSESPIERVEAREMLCFHVSVTFRAIVRPRPFQAIPRPFQIFDTALNGYPGFHWNSTICKTIEIR
jgi:hypothetical protein